jgi:protocatechuate 3,4-dioxygenase, alpha subunit
MTLAPTSWQTVGPFFTISLSERNCDQLAGPAVEGERITIRGRVIDGDGNPVPDALIETWQADARGMYADAETDSQKTIPAAFSGFGRIPTDSEGNFCFSTIKPGPVPARNGSMQAPHILVSIFMRGLLIRLVTRIYFPADPRNASDFVLNLVDPLRRGTLIAEPTDVDGVFQWDVILQGTGETVFFDC